MTRLLSLRNRQRVRAVDTTLLRRVTLHLLRESFRVPHYELAIHLVAAPEMSRLNKTYLRHDGSTDVITFDYSDFEWGRGGGDPKPGTRNPELLVWLHGEIFICLDDAVAQARPFGASWQSELVRYLVHGLLHLQGFDDGQVASRKKMKREENRLIRNLARRFTLSKLGRRNPRRGTTASAA